MNSFTHRSITHGAAQALVTAALEYAQTNGWAVAAAVCDPQGGLVSFGRDDTSAPPIGGFAQDKAYTAATLRKPSAEFGEGMLKSPTLSLGVGTRDRFITWGGGLPIYEDGILIGALGVSGAKEHEDIECATAVIERAGLSVRV